MASRAREKSIGLDVSLLISFLLAVTLTAFVLSLIPRFINVSLDAAAIAKEFIWPASDFSPEPAERLQYIIGTVMFPMVILFSTLALQALLKKFPLRAGILNATRAILLVCIVAGASVLAWFAMAAVDFFYLKPTILYKHPLWFTLLFIVSAAAAALANHFAEKGLGAKIVRWSGNITAICVAATVGFMNVFSASAITNHFMYINHFNAVFYAVTQVHAGKTLLVDISNQYGLYPHLLEPVFAVAGLSVIKFTFVFSLLITIGFASIFVFIRRSVGNTWVALTGFAAVVFLNHVFVKLFTLEDPWFHYFPIRFIFPALFIALSYEYFIKRSKFLYYLITGLAAVSVLWNLDTGLVVFATWLLVLFYQEFLENKIKPAIKKSLAHAGIAISVLAGALGLMFIYLAIRSGSLPDLSGMLAYQRLFLGKGFFLMPMHALAPWNLIALIYGVGLAFSARALVRREAAPLDKAVLLLSVLGLGLFSYYQGRSHILGLCVVSYPATLLLVIACDKLLEGFKRNRPATFINLIPASVLLAVFTAALASLFIWGAGTYSSTTQRMADRQPTPVTTGIDFIAANTKSGQEVLVLSYNSGAYYSECGAANPLDIPGPSELVLRSDFDKILKAVEDRKVGKIFLDTNLLARNPELNSRLMAAVADNYYARGMSRLGNIIMYEKAGKTTRPAVPVLSLPQSTETFAHLGYISQKGVMAGSDRIYFVGTSFGELEKAKRRTIELIIKPGAKGIPDAVILDTALGQKQFTGFRLQQSGVDSAKYTLIVGDGQEWYLSGDIVIAPGKWHYLALVFDGKQISLYDNGISISKIGMERDFKDSAGLLYIGDWAHGNRPMSANTKEIRVLNRALSEEEARNNAELLREARIIK